MGLVVTRVVHGDMSVPIHKVWDRHSWGPAPITLPNICVEEPLPRALHFYPILRQPDIYIFFLTLQRCFPGALPMSRAVPLPPLRHHGTISALRVNPLLLGGCDRVCVS